MRPVASGAGRAGRRPPTAADAEVDLSRSRSTSLPQRGAAGAAAALARSGLPRHARRSRAARSSEEAAAEQYRLALTYHEMGMVDDAIKALEVAARSPRQRFDAASMLGRLYLERKDSKHAIEWFERAAEAPAPTPDAGRALLYDLASTLESVGENVARARGLRRARVRVGRLSRRGRPNRAPLQSPGPRLIPVQAAPIRRPSARNRLAPGVNPVVGVLGTQLLR